MYKFDNGYGASVIKSDYSSGHEYDLWELAVFHNGHICYDSVITYICYDSGLTDDVIGHLTATQVNSYLEKISKLKEKN